MQALASANRQMAEIMQLCNGRNPKEVFIEDELKGVEEYAEMATHYKAEYKELADVFYGMATSEMGHMKNLHGWVVRLIDKEKKDGTRNVPQGMLDVWAWKHKKMITRFNEAEIKLQNYQKL